MRILGIDPGAKRLGIAIVSLDKGPELIHSEIIGLERTITDSYQSYKLRIIEAFVAKAFSICKEFSPNILVSEIVPSKGFNHSAQAQLANTGATSFLCVAYLSQIRVEQISAITVKKKLTGNKNATKPMIRNKVLSIFPELQSRKDDFKTVFDETDAIAIALVGGGFSGK